MKQDIKYTGLSANPSDHEAPDGDLTTALNLISEDGSIKPIYQPKQIATLPGAYYYIRYIHKTARFTHYIVEFFYTENSPSNFMFWFDESVITGATSTPVNISYSSLNQIQWSGFPKVNKINAVGNTLIVTTDTGMHYFLWNSKRNKYQYLGNHIPDLQLSFGLQGSKEIQSNSFNVPLTYARPFTYHRPGLGNSFDYADYSGANDNIDSQIKELTDTVLAKVNLFVKKYSTDAGKFMFPFLVRYALRLYDGSLTMHSSPVLMITDSGSCPHVFITDWHTINFGGVDVYDYLKAKIGAMLFDLDYQVLKRDTYGIVDGDALTNISLYWTDIVKSVDIFISAPIYSYDQAGKVSGWSNLSNTSRGYTVSYDTDGRFIYPLAYNKSYVASILNVTTEEFTLPSKKTTIHENADTTIFYLLKSIPISEMGPGRNKIEISKDYLQSLTTREQMTDDYDSHDTLIPQYLSLYNSRLNIGNIKKVLSKPFNLACYVPFCGTQNYLEGGGSSVFNFYVFLNYDGEDIIIHNEVSAPLSADLPLNHFYYPDANAYKVVIIEYNNGSYRYYTLPLKRHEFLNGAYYHDGWTPRTPDANSQTITETTNRTINYPNKIYSSEVNNPFFFPAVNTNTVGTGIILGINTAAKALSQGQFGQFPLYAFTTDGVWALEISSTGSFSAKQPITRDVCNNPESITQLDDAVIFATDRGLMLLQGSEAICVTDVIATEHPFNVLTKLPHAADLHAMLDHNADTCLPTQPFLAFLSGCRIIYDYVHQHIIVFNTNYTYAYVFSLKSKLWGMMYSNLASSLNSYPDALAMSQDNHLVSFSDTDQDICKGLLITRPLKLGDGDTLKSIHTLLQRGNFQRGDVNTVLYGSRDLVNWHIIASSVNHEIRNLRGTPYKYFRVASVATITPDKSIYGITVDVEPRHTSVLH